jgi:hypothetical protein
LTVWFTAIEPDVVVVNVRFWLPVVMPLVPFTVPTVNAVEVLLKLTGPPLVLAANVLTAFPKGSENVPVPSNTKPPVVVIVPGAVCVTPALAADRLTQPVPVLTAWFIAIEPDVVVVNVRFWLLVAMPLVPFTVPTVNAVEVLLKLTAPPPVLAANVLTAFPKGSENVPVPSNTKPPVVVTIPAVCVTPAPLKET